MGDVEFCPRAYRIKMQKEVNLQNLPYVLDESHRKLGAIGLVILATDHVIEDEFRKILNIPGISLYHSRIKSEITVTQENLSTMETRLEEAVNVILPGMPLDVIAYACTSASMVI